jgi:hypothetical protein
MKNSKALRECNMSVLRRDARRFLRCLVTTGVPVSAYSSVAHQKRSCGVVANKAGTLYLDEFFNALMRRGVGHNPAGVFSSLVVLTILLCRWGFLVAVLCLFVYCKVLCLFFRLY